MTDERKCRYVIDTSAILAQKDDEHYPKMVYKTLWDNIDKMLRDHVIITSSEIVAEIQDIEIKKWFDSLGCEVIELDEEIQKYAAEVVTKNPELIDFTENKSSGDAFLIATAMKYGITVITEENRMKSKKIPKVCESLGVDTVNILMLCQREGWTF